jgi:hypothetical protein
VDLPDNKQGFAAVRKFVLEPAAQRQCNKSIPAAVAGAGATGELDAVGAENFAGEFQRLKTAAAFACGVFVN